MSEAIVRNGEITTDEGLIPRSDYLLSPEEMDRQEQELFAELTPYLEPDQDIVSVVIPWDSKFSSFGRTSETIAYRGYDNHAAMKSYEHHSFFIYTIDTEHGIIGHVKRIVEPKTPEEREMTRLTGIEVIDDRLSATSADEHADLDEIISAHNIEEIENCWNVTSNHRTKRLDTDFLARPYVLVSYKAVFELGRSAGVNRLFAYLNSKAINSLAGENMQIQYELVGNKEFHLPEPTNPGEYDQDYLATCIPYTSSNIDKFVKEDESVPGTLLIANREVPIYIAQDTDSSTTFSRL